VYNDCRLQLDHLRHSLMPRSVGRGGGGWVHAVHLIEQLEGKERSVVRKSSNEVSQPLREGGHCALVDTIQV
jgi:hypothetical protein